MAHQHPNGGDRTLSRALGETLPALEALEAQKTQTGKDFFGGGARAAAPAHLCSS